MASTPIATLAKNALRTTHLAIPQWR